MQTILTAVYSDQTRYDPVLEPSRAEHIIRTIHARHGREVVSVTPHRANDYWVTVEGDTLAMGILDNGLLGVGRITAEVTEAP